MKRMLLFAALVVALATPIAVAYASSSGTEAPAAKVVSQKKSKAGANLAPAGKVHDGECPLSADPAI
jgi:hypothetical protein